ncbi:hypothetical protein HOO68_00130 [Candidatus Gracilibacteria bacterium]|nr:hypothetical protein [Candidatus Gracilibacteria bacterium]
MIYIDGSPEILDLIKLWTPSSIGVEIGSDSATVLQKLQANIKCILIGPWYYIRKDAQGVITPDSNMFVSRVKQGVHDGICTIFGGNGEVSVFGEESVITDTPSRKKYLEVIHSIEKKRLVA